MLASGKMQLQAKAGQAVQQPACPVVVLPFPSSRNAPASRSQVRMHAAGPQKVCCRLWSLKQLLGKPGAVASMTIAHRKSIYLAVPTRVPIPREHLQARQSSPHRLVHAG